MTNAGAFEPNKAITRAEMAKTIDLALAAGGRALPQGGDTVFSDNDSLSNKAEISAVYNAGILSGYPDNTFGGERTLTRAEAAVVLEKLI